MMLAKRQSSQTVALPAPVGGWNARDPISNMDSLDAVTMENFYPGQGKVSLRPGYVSFATGMGASASIETLMTYNGGTGSKLFAAVGANIYNITAGGAVGAADVSALTNARWQCVNFGTGGGQFLIAVNGADSPLNYNGTAWATTPAITGVTVTNLINVNVFKQRLFFVEKNSLKFWYLGVNSIGGAATSYDLSPMCRLGGYLVAMGTWSIDGGIGIDDYAVFITSAGEVLVFKGTDPNSASTWALTGVFHVGAPVSYRCMFKMGPDLVVMSQDGFMPLSRSLLTDRTAPQQAISNKISGAVSEATGQYANNFGWQATLYPKGSMGIFNIPVQQNKVAFQYVVNTITGAWCKFTNINANCWGVLGNNIYFGANDGKVYQFDSGYSDNGANIVAKVRQAPSNFGYSGNKQFTMIRPVTESPTAPPVNIALNVDFANTEPTMTTTYQPLNVSYWNVSYWNNSYWSTGNGIRKDWQSVSGIGYMGSPHIILNTNKMPVNWYQTEVIFSPGGQI